MAAGSDFVNVQLSAAGAAAAGVGGQLRITAAHLTYVFTAGASVRVLTSEWRNVLSKERIKGKLIFELTPGSTAAAADKAQLQTLKTEEAALESKIAKEGS